MQHEATFKENQYSPQCRSRALQCTAPESKNLAQEACSLADAGWDEMGLKPSRGRA